MAILPPLRPDNAMKSLQVLEAARALIADPKLWTTGAAARDVAGRRVDPASLDAVCWCALGALRAVDPDIDEGHQAARALRASGAKLYVLAPFLVNDNLGHAAVLAMYDDAIDRVAPDLAGSR